MSLDARVLVVDDEPAQRELLAGFLRDLGAEVAEAAGGRAALEALGGEHPDVLITDLRMPAMDGAELVAAVKEANPGIEVVVVTAYGTVPDAVACLKRGAADFLLKPLDLDQVEHVVRRAAERRQLVRENRELRRRLGEIESLPGIVTAGGAMSGALSTVARAAPSEVPILILGESGTGKELIARAVHAASRRAGGPFVAVSGASLSPTLLESELFGHQRGAFTGAERSRRGRFEAASGGTLFLDEVGDLPPEVQVKLLRALQEGEVERVGSSVPTAVDVRVLAATHRDLPAEVAAGRFREDLYYRLAVVTVELPPLRRRRADVPLLVEHFRTKHGGGKRFSRQAMDRLVAYDYPGNVRELENVVQRCLVLARGDVIAAADLPPAIAGDAGGAGPDDGAGGDGWTLPERVARLERGEIEAALALAGGNQSRAAERLGISERRLRYKLARLGLRGVRGLVSCALWGCGLWALTAGAPPAAAGGLGVEVEAEHVAGDFGTGRAADLDAVTLGLEAGGRLRWRLEVPALRARVSGVVLRTRLGTSPRVRRALAAGRELPPELLARHAEGEWASGLGDVRLALGGDLAGGGARLHRLEGVVELKAPTADDDLGLGSGEWDLRLGVGGERRFWSATAFAGAGWNRLGDPPGVDLRDPLDGYAGIESEPGAGGRRWAAWIEGSGAAVPDAGERAALAVGVAGGGRVSWRLVATAGLTGAAEDFALSFAVAHDPARRRLGRP